MIRHNKYIFPIEIRLKKESTCYVTDAFPFDTKYFLFL